MICYKIIPHYPEAHIYRVTLDIAFPDENGQIFSMPTWIPGSYMVRDFAKNVVSISATSKGKPILITQLDKQTWEIAGSFGPVRVIYDLYAWDLSVRTAYLDQFRGYFNGPSVFLQVHGAESEPCFLEVCLPEGEIYEHWSVATSLRKDGAKQRCYCADDYFELIDHPVELGLFESAKFQVASIPHEIVISGRHNADLPRLCSDLERICDAQRKIFGQLPLDRYLFLVAAVGDGYGGLEHKHSTSLLCNRADLPKTKQQKISDGYRRFLGLCSHEYFHLWNVKRICPAAFVDVPLDSEAYTRLLWVFEGITSYYDELILVRAGLITAESYLELLAQTITRVTRVQGRFKQTLEESSFNTWTKFYKQDENAPNAIVSYYSKGALVALSLDLTIRHESAGKYSLDDVMRAFWNKYGVTNIGVPEDGFERLAVEVTGLNLRPFFQSYVRGTEDPPLHEQLARQGINLELRQMKNQSDLGGFITSSCQNKSLLTLGVKFLSSVSEAKIQQVFDGGAAQQAGISAGDELVAVDGIKCTAKNIDALVAVGSTEVSLNIHLFRRDELLLIQIQPKAAPADTCDLSYITDPTSEMISNRCRWLQIDE